jgi:hypothetical protein
MSGGRIFLAWFLTVIAGSIGLPFVVFIYRISFYGTGYFISLDSGILGMMLISMVISGLCSLPTVISLLVRNGMLKKKNISFKAHFRKINITHVIMAILTLLVFEGVILINLMESHRFRQAYNVSHSLRFSDFEGLIASFLLIVWYSFVAFTSWFLIFKSKINAAEDSMKDSLLDN